MTDAILLRSMIYVAVINVAHTAFIFCDLVANHQTMSNIPGRLALLAAVIVSLIGCIWGIVRNRLNN